MVLPLRALVVTFLLGALGQNPLAASTPTRTQRFMASWTSYDLPSKEDLSWAMNEASVEMLVEIVSKLSTEAPPNPGVHRVQMAQPFTRDNKRAAVLAIIERRQMDALTHATNNLEKSSKTLEKLTWCLIILAVPIFIEQLVSLRKWAGAFRWGSSTRPGIKMSLRRRRSR